MSEQIGAAPMMDRRTALAGAGAAAVLATLWPTTKAEAQPKHRRGKPVFDVACLGHTFAANLTEAIDAQAGNLRGAGFNVEGLIYPANTIPTGDGFDPDSQTTNRTVALPRLVHLRPRPRPPTRHHHPGIRARRGQRR